MLAILKGAGIASKAAAHRNNGAGGWRGGAKWRGGESCEESVAGAIICRNWPAAGENIESQYQYK